MAYFLKERPGLFTPRGLAMDHVISSQIYLSRNFDLLKTFMVVIVFELPYGNIVVRNKLFLLSST